MDKTYVLTSDGELYHWKYIKREKINGKWRYYYDRSSAKKDFNNVVSNIRNSFKKIASVGAKTVKKTITKAVNASVKNVSKVKSKVDDFVKRVKKTQFKYIAKVPVGDTFRYFYSEEAYAAYLNGKNAVDKAMSKIEDKTVGALIDDQTKSAVDNFISDVMNNGFGKAVYNLVLPALTALQVAIQTPKSFNDMKKIDGEHSNDEDQEAVNPDYDPTKFDYSYNCSFCTAAYDLRKRGYDVEAMSISVLEGPVIEDILSWYEGAEAVSENDVKASLPKEDRYGIAYSVPEETYSKRVSALNTSLESHGDGARGHLCMYWTMGGGHDIVWSVENGLVVYRDCQTNEVLNIADVLRYVDDYSYIRVDNCEVTEEILRTVRNRK